jgi:hypothetical protein
MRDTGFSWKSIHQGRRQFHVVQDRIGGRDVNVRSFKIYWFADRISVLVVKSHLYVPSGDRVGAI